MCCINPDFSVIYVDAIVFTVNSFDTICKDLRYDLYRWIIVMNIIYNFQGLLSKGSRNIICLTEKKNLKQICSDSISTIVQEIANKLFKFNFNLLLNVEKYPIHHGYLTNEICTS